MVGETHRRTPKSISTWEPTGSWRPLLNREKILTPVATSHSCQTNGLAVFSCLTPPPPTPSSKMLHSITLPTHIFLFSSTFPHSRSRQCFVLPKSVPSDTGRLWDTPGTHQTKAAPELVVSSNYKAAVPWIYTSASFPGVTVSIKTYKAADAGEGPKAWGGFVTLRVSNKGSILI